MKNKTKEDIIEDLNVSLGISKNFLKKFINDFIKILSISIKEHNKINIKNFGTFNLKYKKKRVGRNPKTKEIYEISNRMSIIFKTSKTLKNLINGNI